MLLDVLYPRTKCEEKGGDTPMGGPNLTDSLSFPDTL